MFHVKWQVKLVGAWSWFTMLPQWSRAINHVSRVGMIKHVEGWKGHFMLPHRNFAKVAAATAPTATHSSEKGLSDSSNTAVCIRDILLFIQSSCLSQHFGIQLLTGMQSFQFHYFFQLACALIKRLLETVTWWTLETATLFLEFPYWIGTFNAESAGCWRFWAILNCINSLVQLPFSTTETSLVNVSISYDNNCSCPVLSIFISLISLVGFAYENDNNCYIAVITCFFSSGQLG